MSEAAMQLMFDIIILGNTSTGKKTLRNSLASISPQDALLAGNSSRISMTKRKYRLSKDSTFGVRYWLSRGDYRTQANFIKTIENIQAVLVLVDLSDRKSLLKLDGYFNSFARRNLPIFIIGNKLDLNRVISTKEMMNLAIKLNAQYIEVSLLAGENVEEMKQSILLTALKECDVKGGCSNFLKSTRELQNQRKRVAFSRLAMQMSCGKRFRSDLLSQVAKQNYIPNIMLQVEEIAADERDFDFYQTRLETGTEQSFLPQAQLRGINSAPQGTIEQTLEKANPTPLSSFPTTVTPSLSENKTIKLLSSNTNLMNDLRSTVTQFLKYVPLSIEVINQ